MLSYFHLFQLCVYDDADDDYVAVILMMMNVVFYLHKAQKKTKEITFLDFCDKSVGKKKKSLKTFQTNEKKNGHVRKSTIS